MQKSATEDPMREPAIPIPIPMPARLLDVEGVADRLGVNTRHVRRLVHERRIPFIKWGHLLRFDPIEIDAWLRRSTTPERSA
jgi:excisionase family DNA binding protein